MIQDRYAAPLPVRGRRVVVVGAGPATLGQVSALVDAGAVVSVVAGQAAAAIDDLADRGVITWHEREWHPDDLVDTWLVIAAVDDDRLVHECETRRLWCLPVYPVATPSGQPSTQGRVTLVGGGPGDPDLLTVGGMAALRSADVVVVDRLAPLAVLADLPKAPTVIDVSKIPGGRSTSQERINALLVEHAERGAQVVRLKGGDSFVFGRGGEEVIACAKAGVPVRVIPGVTSAVAAPELAGIPVTHRGLSQGFTVVSGHLPPGHPDSTIDYGALARGGTTLVLLMAVANLQAISVALIDGGLSPATPCAVVADAAMASQRSIRSTLDQVAADASAAAVVAPAVTVIGDVAALISDAGAGAADVLAR
ncbi:uroporphyrinogen-III C-methyltransferase [Leekyejoonella antrihumi]|uniref:uroporphyrinogen-III C-methyltransferase n=1 Tax=Leekyejoonella antrihumi TaxID=1660198 RepID=UPI001FE6F468|nr:uroporphyrinogen-III C-methyltransferase [Leekyejoonella antrihumi]